MDVTCGDSTDPQSVPYSRMLGREKRCPTRALYSGGELGAVDTILLDLVRFGSRVVTLFGS